MTNVNKSGDVPKTE